MDLNKHLEYFEAPKIEEAIHIIGVGAIGSTIAEMLTRLGVFKLHIWDFDHVTPHNVANQMFLNKHINKKKIDAVEEILKEINPNIEIIKHEEYKDQILSGYIFMCVDSMEVRKTIIKNHKYNQAQVVGLFDFRMGLEEAQHYASPFNNTKDITILEKLTDFSTEDAAANVPKNSCGMELAIISTVRAICALGISNFINFVKEKELKRFIQINAFNFNVDAM